jgi:hypothetical protein
MIMRCLAIYCAVPFRRSIKIMDYTPIGNQETIHETHILMVNRKQNIGVPRHAYAHTYTHVFLHNFQSFKNILRVKFNRHKNW